MRSLIPRLFISAILICLTAVILPLPALAQGDLLITNATVIVGTGEIIENGSILIQNGKITAIGSNVEGPEGIKIVDASGKYAMPGIIDQHSHLAQASTNEMTSQNSAEVDISDVIVNDDYGMYRALAGGVTTVHILHGSGNVIGGRDDVIKLKWGGSREDILFKNNPEGVKFALGENPIRGDQRYPNSRMGVEHILRNEFTRVQEYKRAWEEYELKKDGKIKPENKYEKKNGPVPPRRDIQLEALVGVLEGTTRSHVHAYTNHEIAMFDRVAKEFGFNPTSYEHVLEGYMVGDELAETGSVASIFADFWNYKVEASKAIPYNAALLYERGVKVSINSDSPELIRRLNLDAAKTIRYGNVPEDEAIRMITHNAAYGLRLHDRVGTLKVGMDGDVAIFNGHPFSVYSKCVKTIIEGVVYFDLDSTLTTEKWLEKKEKKEEKTSEVGK